MTYTPSSTDSHPHSQHSSNTSSKKPSPKGSPSNTFLRKINSFKTKKSNSGNVLNVEEVKRKLTAEASKAEEVYAQQKEEISSAKPEKKEKISKTVEFLTDKGLAVIQKTAEASQEKNTQLLKSTFGENYSENIQELNKKIEEFFPLLSAILPVKILTPLMEKREQTKEATQQLAIFILANIVSYTYPKTQENITLDQCLTDFTIKFSQEVGEEFDRLEVENYNKLINDHLKFFPLAKKLLEVILPKEKKIKGGFLVQFTDKVVNIREKILGKIAQQLNEQWNTLCGEQSLWFMRGSLLKSKFEFNKYVSNSDIKEIYKVVFHFLPPQKKIYKETEKFSPIAEAEIFYVFEKLCKFTYKKMPEEPVEFETFLKDYKAALLKEIKKKKKFDAELILTPDKNYLKNEEHNLIFICAKAVQKMSKSFYKSENYEGFVDAITTLPLPKAAKLGTEEKKQASGLTQFVVEKFSSQFKERGENYFEELTGNNEIPKIISQLVDPLYKVISKKLPSSLTEILGNDENLNKQAINALILQLFKNLTERILKQADGKISSQEVIRKVVNELLQLFKNKFEELNKRKLDTIQPDDLNSLSKELLKLALPNIGFLDNFIVRREKRLCGEISKALFEIYKIFRPKNPDLDSYKDKLVEILGDNSPNLDKSIDQIQALSNNLAKFIKQGFVKQLQTEKALQKQLAGFFAGNFDESFQELIAIVQSVLTLKGENSEWIDTQVQNILEQSIFKGIVLLLEKSTEGKQVDQENILGSVLKYLLDPCIEEFPKIFKSFSNENYRNHLDFAPYMQGLTLQDAAPDQDRITGLKIILESGNEQIQFKYWQTLNKDLKGVRFKDLKTKLTKHAEELKLMLSNDQQAQIVEEVLNSFGNSTTHESYPAITDKIYHRLVETHLVSKLENGNFKNAERFLKAWKSSSNRDETINNYLHNLEFEVAQEEWAVGHSLDFNALLPELKLLDENSKEESLQDILETIKKSYLEKQATTQEEAGQALLQGEALKDLYSEVILEKESTILKNKVNECLKKIPREVLTNKERREFVAKHDFKSYIRELSKEHSNDERKKIAEGLIQEIDSFLVLKDRQKRAKEQLIPFVKKLLNGVFSDSSQKLSFNDFLPVHSKIKDKVADLIVKETASVISQFFVVTTDGIHKIPQSRKELQTLYKSADESTYGENNPGNLARTGFIVGQTVGPGIAFACREKSDLFLTKIWDKLAPLCGEENGEELESLKVMITGLVKEIGDAYQPEAPEQYKSALTFVGQLCEGFILRTFIDLTNQLMEKEKATPKDEPSLLENEIIQIIDKVTTHCKFINEVKTKTNGKEELGEAFKKKFEEQEELTTVYKEEDGLKVYTKEIAPKMLSLLNLDESSLPIPPLFQDTLWKLMQEDVLPTGLEKVLETVIDSSSWHKAILALVDKIENKPESVPKEVKQRLPHKDKYQKDLQNKIAEASVQIMLFQPSKVLKQAIKNKKVPLAIGNAIAVPLREFMRPKIDEPLSIAELLNKIAEVAADKIHLCRWNDEESKFEFLSEDGVIEEPDFSKLFPTKDEQEEIKAKREEEKQEHLRSVPKKIAMLVNKETDKRVAELYKILWDHLIEMVDTIIDQVFKSDENIDGAIKSETSNPRVKKIIHAILKVVVGIPLKIIHYLFHFLIWVPLRFFAKSSIKKQIYRRVGDVQYKIHGNLLIKIFDQLLQEAS